MAMANRLYRGAYARNATLRRQLQLGGPLGWCALIGLMLHFFRVSQGSPGVQGKAATALRRAAQRSLSMALCCCLLDGNSEHSGHAFPLSSPRVQWGDWNLALGLVWRLWPRVPESPRLAPTQSQDPRGFKAQDWCNLAEN